MININIINIKQKLLCANLICSQNLCSLGRLLFFLDTYFTLYFHKFIQSQLCTLKCALKNPYKFCHFNIKQSKIANQLTHRRIIT